MSSKKTEETEQVSFRVPKSSIRRIDEVAAKKSKAAGVTITRTQVVLLALREWLEGHAK